jgi:hypothetical protein
VSDVVKSIVKVIGNDAKMKVMDLGCKVGGISF